jgi:hypothetical protein
MIEKYFDSGVSREIAFELSQEAKPTNVWKCYSRSDQLVDLAHDAWSMELRGE